MKKFILTVVFILSSFCFANEKESDVAIVTEELVNTTVFCFAKEKREDVMIKEELVPSTEEELGGYCHVMEFKWKIYSEYSGFSNSDVITYIVFEVGSCF